jgi:hypothetical protein
MPYLYILTDPANELAGNYKIGITSKERNALLAQYSRYMPRARVVYFVYSSAAREIERDILAKLAHHRISNNSGGLSEWVRMAPDKLLGIVRLRIALRALAKLPRLRSISILSR